jgi:adenylate cyclase
VPNIVSDATRADAPGFVYRELDLVRVAGKKEPVRIFEVVGREGEVDAATLSAVQAFATMLAHYRAQQWDDAQRLLDGLFSALESAAGEASLYGVYAERIAQLRQTTLPADWDAVYTFDKK